MRRVILFAAILLAGCASQQAVKTNYQAEGPAATADKLLEAGFKELSQRNTGKAAAYFDQAIEACKAQYDNTEQMHYAARTPQESLYYLLKAAGDKQPAVALPVTCADALYLKGYASLDLGQLEVAEEFIKRAVTMSPVNAMYLEELGHIYQAKHNWQLALDTFAHAEEYAGQFSPKEVKDKELTRAKRGMGFSLTEMGRLDEAAAKYRECLEIDSGDARAINELKYIQQLRDAKETKVW